MTISTVLPLGIIRILDLFIWPIVLITVGVIQMPFIPHQRKERWPIHQPANCNLTASWEDDNNWSHITCTFRWKPWFEVNLLTIDIEVPTLADTFIFLKEESSLTSQLKLMTFHLFQLESWDLCEVEPCCSRQYLIGNLLGNLPVTIPSSFSEKIFRYLVSENYRERYGNLSVTLKVWSVSGLGTSGNTKRCNMILMVWVLRFKVFWNHHLQYIMHVNSLKYWTKFQNNFKKHAAL